MITNPGPALVHLFCRGIAARLVPSNKWTGSRFGGPSVPSAPSVRSSTPLAGDLHLIAVLAGGHIPNARMVGRAVPLVYGLRFDGCVVRYRFAADGISIDSLAPAVPAEDWPYRDYPSVLPYVPLEVGDSRQSTWEAFAANFPNLAAEQPAELVALVPPAMTLGVSLWGPDGDAEDTTIVFECDLEARSIRAYNTCS
jgi:hypothetical protein